MKSTRFLVASLLSLCVAAALAPSGPAARQKAGEGQQQPRFRAGVAYVRVDVYPTSNGRIVPDLKQDELEVLEDGVPQRIEAFEHVVVRAAGAEAERSEPSSIAASLEAAGDPRNRLFVLFFDTLHTLGYGGRGGAIYDPRTVGRALAGFLERLIGADDLVGVITPEQSLRDLTFTRRPSSFEDFLRSGARWQERFMEGEMDDTERKYTVCYPAPLPYAPKMIARRRELFVLTVLRDLMVLLENLREGRTAVLLVSEGWTLFRPDASLSEPIRDRVPALPPIDIGGLRPGVGRQREGNVEYLRVREGPGVPGTARQRTRFPGDAGGGQPCKRHVLSDRHPGVVHRVADEPAIGLPDHAGHRDGWNGGGQQQRLHAGPQAHRRRSLLGTTSSATTRPIRRPMAGTGESPCASSGPEWPCGRGRATAR